MCIQFTFFFGINCPACLSESDRNFPHYMRIALPRGSLSFCSFVRHYSVPAIPAPSPQHRRHTPLPPRPACMAAKKEFNREELDELLKRRFFISRSFDIYGGVAGLYDLGVRSTYSQVFAAFLTMVASRMCSPSKHHRHVASSFHLGRRHARGRLYHAHSRCRSSDVWTRR